MKTKVIIWQTAVDFLYVFHGDHAFIWHRIYAQTAQYYTVSQKKACDYIFGNNWNNECPIIIIFGTLINETICHRMVVLFPTSSI